MPQHLISSVSIGSNTSSHANQRVKPVLPVSVKGKCGMKGTGQVAYDSPGCAVLTFTLLQASYPRQTLTWFYIDIHMNNSKIFCICHNKKSHNDRFHNVVSPNKVFPCGRAWSLREVSLMDTSSVLGLRLIWGIVELVV